MEISCNNQYKNNTNFNGLTRCLKKTVYNSESMIDAFVQAHPNSKGFAGNLPREFISNIKKKNTVDVAKKIDIVKTAFSSVSNDLRVNLCKNEYDTKKNIFKKLSFDDFLFAQADQNDFEMLRAIRKVNIDAIKCDLITDDELRKYNVRLAKALKETNVLPLSAKVKMSYLGGGSFGNAFKMSFLDKDNKKIFHDKVLKVYKSVDEIEYQNKYAFDTMKNFINQSTPEEYIKKINRIVEDNANNVRFRPINTYRLVENYEFLRQATINDIYGCHRQFILSNLHGVQPEANAALFIKKAIGKDISISNMVEPHCFDLKNNYAIMEMSDNESKTLKKITLRNMGIECYDKHDDNVVNDKLIDYGAIKVFNKDVLKNRKCWGDFKINIEDKQILNANEKSFMMQPSWF